MGLFRSLAGMVRFSITSADVPGVLRAINHENVLLHDVVTPNELSVQASVSRQDFAVVKRVAQRRGENLNVVHRYGVYWTLKSALRRPVLVTFTVLLLLMTIYLPTRILFVQIEGNNSISSNLILERAAQCGISFGASRSAVRSEKMKNALLAAIPELQWAGVNTSGCVATISVREKSLSQEDKHEEGISSIVALRDGIIYDCTITRGNQLCTVGQAVKAGQTLVSGYTDTGLSIQATNAQAEITAKTNRDLEVVSLRQATRRGEQIGQERKYSLLIGKKLINFCKDSGISDASCVKMYSVDYLTLPGGFHLPIALVTETRDYYASDPVTLDSESFGWMTGFSSSYLLKQMVAGQIDHADTQTELTEDLYILHGRYACLESIGQVKKEEILGNYGESN